MGGRADRDENERTQLLRLLGESPSISQREIARSLGVSVGKTHYLLKAFIEKGVVKVDSFGRSDNKIGYAYYLTPRGFKEKAALTRRFFARQLTEYEALSRDIEQLRRELEADRESDVQNS